MKKGLVFTIIIAIASFIGCPKEPKTLLEQTQHLEMGKYWAGHIDVDAGVNLKVEIAVDTSGGKGDSVDVLLMDSMGYREFEGMFKTDTVFKDSDSLPPSQGRHYYFYVENDKIAVDFSSDKPTDIYLYHQDLTTIAFYPDVTAQIFDYSAAQAETLCLLLSNSDPTTVVRYDVLVTKLKTSFTYYEALSALNVIDTLWTFKIPFKGKYYIVVNNTGGATPERGVDFRLVVTAQ